MAATPSAKHQLDPMERDPPDAVRKSMDSMCPALRSVRAGAARRRLGQIEVDHHKRSGAAPPPLPLERKADPPPPPNMLQSSIGHATVACELGGMQECSFDHARRSQDTAPETRVECGLPCAFPTTKRTRVLGREWVSSAHAAKKRRAMHPKASPKRSAMVLCNIRLDTHANNMRPHNPYLGGMGDRPTNSIGGVTSALRQCCLWLCQVRGAKGGRERTPLSP